MQHPRHELPTRYMRSLVCVFRFPPSLTHRYDTLSPPHSASGTAAVQYTDFADKHSVTGTYTGDRSGPWLSLDCTLIPDPSPAILVQWCLWSPRTDLAATRAELEGGDAPFPSAYVSLTQGTTNLCYRDAPLAASIVSVAPCYVLVDRSLADGAKVPEVGNTRVFANARIDIYRMARVATVAVQPGAGLPADRED